jgi:transposase
MPSALSDTQLDIVKTMLNGKFDQAKIAEAASCSIRQVKRIKKNIATFGTAKAPKLKAQGRPRLAIQDAAEVFSLFLSMNSNSYQYKGLREFLLSKPWAYRDEMQQFLYDDLGIWVDVSTISRVLCREKISRKKVYFKYHDKRVY